MTREKEFKKRRERAEKRKILFFSLCLSVLNLTHFFYARPLLHAHIHTHKEEEEEEEEEEDEGFY